MGGQSLSFWFRADITLLLKSDYTTTATYKLTNREVFNTDGVVYYPLISALNDIGTQLTNYIPADINSSFTIRNDAGSFGFKRKFSDLLDRYTPIDQAVTLYYAATTAEAIQPSSWTTLFSAKIKSVSESINDTQQTLTFNIQADTIPREAVGYTFTNDPFDNPAIVIDDSLVGKTLPVIFGEDVQARGITFNRTDVTATLHKWFFTTEMSYLDELTKYLIRDTEQLPQYVEVFPAIDINNNIITDSNVKTRYRAVNINFDQATEASLLTHVEFEVKGNLGGSWTATTSLFAEIWSRNPATNKPKKLIARTEVEKVDYIANFQAATATFLITLVFNKPVALIDPNGYFLAYGQDVDDDANGVGVDDAVSFRYDSAAATIQTCRFVRTTANAEGEAYRWRKQGSTKAIYYQLYTADFTYNYGDDDYRRDTFAPTSVDVECEALPTGADENCDLSQMDFICEFTGPYSIGTFITGTDNELITRPDHVIKYLFYHFDYDGDGSLYYDPTDIHSSFSAFSTVPFSRNINGATTNLLYLPELIQAVLRNSASRLFLNNSGKLALWAWGEHQEPTFNIPQSDIKVNSFRINDASNVINSFIAYYNKILGETNFLKQSTQNEFKDYAGALLQTDQSTNTLYDKLSTASRAMFLNRNLEDNRFDWINDSISMQSVAYYFLAKLALPISEVDIEIPFDKYQAINLLDVGTIQSPSLPNFYGAWPDATPIYTDGVAVDWKLGEYTTYAKTYRAQVEGKRVKLNLNGAPTLVLNLEILQNYPADPT